MSCVTGASESERHPAGLPTRQPTLSSRHFRHSPVFHADSVAISPAAFIIDSHREAGIHQQPSRRAFTTLSSSLTLVTLYAVMASGLQEIPESEEDEEILVPDASQQRHINHHASLHRKGGKRPMRTTSTRSDGSAGSDIVTHSTTYVRNKPTRNTSQNSNPPSSTLNTTTNPPRRNTSTQSSVSHPSTDPGDPDKSWDYLGVTDKRLSPDGNGIEYHVKWATYDKVTKSARPEWTWEPYSEDFKTAIEAYELTDETSQPPVVSPSNRTVYARALDVGYTVSHTHSLP